MTFRRALRSRRRLGGLMVALLLGAVMPASAAGAATPGTVWAWGYNFSGQLGNNNALTDSSTPVQVLGPGGTGVLTVVTAIATGGAHSLALESDGSVWG